MTVSVVKLRGRIRSKLRDLDGKADSPGTVEVDMAMADAYLALQSELPQMTLYTTSALTISAGSDLFSLPVTVTSSGYGTGTEEYAGQVDLQLVSNGRFLRRYTLDEFNAFRDGQVAVVTGVPERFALYEDGSQVVRGRCYPGAKIAEVCNMYSSLQVNDLRDYVGTGGAEGLDTATTNLSRLGAAALVNRTCALLAAKMTPEALKLRGLNPNVISLWDREADVLLYQEAARRNAIESNGKTQRRVP